MTKFKNPIIPGFYPDPSICRVGEDYYLVTSSFAYFPGVPIFHSKDLVNWEQIGHVLDRESQLDLDGLEQSQGIFAPTIRYNDGIFYMITTNVDKKGNFIVTATNPAGPWSDPYYLDSPGIDPSLFFDDDGKVYYTGNRYAPEGQAYDGNCEIWMQELDLKEMKLIGEDIGIWRGALKDAVWPEGPHIYKVDGMYYLLISEAGTAHHHALTIAKSKNIKGPYIGNPGNPILTHRHLGKNFPITNVGHGDLVETENGEWWCVCLASRPYGGYFRNMGRETFLVPVEWEDGWPVLSPGTGKVEWTYDMLNLKDKEAEIKPYLDLDNFQGRILDFKWNFLRTPREKFWSLEEEKGLLALKLRPESINDLANPSLIIRRQQHINFSASTLLEFTPEKEGETAGLVLLQSNLFNFQLVYKIENSKKVLQLIKCTDGENQVLAEKEIEASKLCLKVKARGQVLTFYYKESGVELSDSEDMKILVDHIDGRILSTDIAGGFVGTTLGMYASSNKEESNNVVYFHWFKYKEDII
ncbi:glycoside hydrolase family 43 protein [Clostridium grantii]|uniref:Alpha-N-arabinofuranosidase n=1 Tax=Clostridium grantii DSM 8605 TaxID=1121316 RepID=A0A1M5VWA8_9CLOT|nr:glycoside hydrolase family 43 protein [Clostridium grantii]SHH79284.1 alpha-N-arabinofuranosidase [Clostridium grantii DSM 8605]